MRLDRLVRSPSPMPMRRTIRNAWDALGALALVGWVLAARAVWRIRKYARPE